MKVKRYLHGSTNIDELQAGRRAIISPARAAQLEGAPYEAVAGAAKSIANDLTALRKHQLAEDERLRKEEERLRDEEDDQTEKLISIQGKARVNALRTDTKYKDQMQANGDPTASAMLNDIEEHFSAQMAATNDIQDPVRRKRFQELLRLQQDSDRIYVRSLVNEKREGWATQADFELLNVMVEGQSWDEAKVHVEAMFEKGRMSEPRRRQFMGMIDGEQKSAEARDIVESHRQQIAMDEGAEVLSKVISNPHKDPEIQAMIEAGVRAEITNYNVINKKVKDARIGQWAREVDKLLISIEDPNTTVDIDSLYESMVHSGLNPVKASEFANHVSAAQRKRTVKQDSYDIYTAELEAGFEFENSASNRANTDRYLQAQIESAPEGSRPIDIEIETYRDTGLVGQRRQTEMKNASTVENIAEQAEFYHLLNAETYIQATDGLSATKRSLYEQISKRAADGQTSWLEAAQNVLQLRDIDFAKREVREQEWTSMDASDAEGYYKNLIDSDAYDKSFVPFRSGVEGINHDDNLVRYRLYLQEGYMLNGNIEDAVTHADTMFKSSHVVTNINGYPEMQVGGISMTLKNGGEIDLSPLRQKFFEESGDKPFLYTNVDNEAVLAPLQMDGLTFDNPKMLAGETRYDVYVNESPLTNPETGKQVRVYFDSTDVQELQVAQRASWEESQQKAREEAAQKDIDRLERHIKRGERVGFDVKEDRRKLELHRQRLMELQGQ